MSDNLLDFMFKPLQDQLDEINEGVKLEEEQYRKVEEAILKGLYNARN